MPTFEPTYADYLAQANYGQGGSETGSSAPLSEEDWNRLDTPGKWMNLGGGFTLRSDDPRFEEFNAIVGDPEEPDRDIFISIGDPDKAYKPDWIRDPNRILRGEGWHAISETNFTPDYGRAEETDRRGMYRRGAIAGLVALGGAYLLGGAMAGGAAEAGALGVTAEGSAGIGMGATGTGAIDFGVAGAASGAAGASTSTAGATQAAAPVTDLSTTASRGILGSATDLGSSVSNAYNGLSPAARLVVNQALSSGAQAGMSALAQRNARQAAEERENREREDRVRRGSVPAFGPNAFTPRPGIIGSALTPRGRG